MKRLLFFSLIIFAVSSCNKDEVQPSNPLVCFEFPVGELRTGEQIQFTSCTTGATEWLWQFGDAGTSSYENPTHTYSQPGSYDVKLTVKLNGKEVSEVKKIVIVKALIFYHPATTIAKDSTWVRGIHIVKGTINVSGAKLTIEAGATVKFNQGGDKRINVGTSGLSAATLVANGTSQLPIVFTSNASLPTANSWGALSFGPNLSTTPVISNAVIEYGGGTFDYNRPNAPVEFLGGGKADITNTVIRKTTKYGVYLSQESGFSIFTGNTIDLESESGHVVFLDADHLHTFKDELNTLKGKGILISFTPITTNVTIEPMLLPFYTEHSLLIGNTTETTFTITAGTEINFAGGGAILLGGAGYLTKLLINGTQANPVKLKSTSTAPWVGIRITKGFSPSSIINYAIITDAYYGGPGEAIIKVTDAVLNLTNSSISGPMPYTIWMDASASFGTFTNNTIGMGATHSMMIDKKHFKNFPKGNTFAGLGDPRASIFVMASNVSTTTFNIAENFTITDPGAPYYMLGNISVGNPANTAVGPTLTIEPGVDLRFKEYHGLYIGVETYNFPPALDATVIMNGTAEKPIRLGPIPGYTNWEGVFFDNGTNPNCSMQYTTVEGARENNVRITVGNGASATKYPLINNCTFKNAVKYPIFVETNNNPNIGTNNTYTGNGTNSVFFQ